MAATSSSPLPRWMPTPSPSRPLWRWGGGMPDARNGTGTGAGGTDWSLGRLFPWQRRPAVAGVDGVEVAPTQRAATDIVDDPGVLLTWEDVCVTVAGGAYGGQPVSILRGISGHAGPGEVLAIMGPSGCGKTTLLDTLAGRLGPGVNETGLILINGRREKLAFGTSAYVTQDNMLMSTMSVREAVYYSAQLQLPGTMAAAEKRTHTDGVIREMGLGDAMDTRIGGRMTKGISGGQRKRLTICVEMLTRPRLLFLDEPTSGLDSAASYHVMSHIARVAAREGMTVVAAVHQPSGDVFDLFHSLCLLAYGRTIFFGAASDATQFFSQSGFPCPQLRNPSDHFLRTINKDFDEEIVESSKARRKTAAEAIDILTDAYQSPAYSEKTMNQIAEMKGITRCEVIMYTTALLTFMAIGGFPSFVEDIKVFRRERLSGHYGVAEFVISNTLSATPYLAAISVIPGAMLYYLTGLTKGADNFAYFVINLCMCTLLVESMMMIIAVIIPDFLMGIIVGAGVQGVMMLNGGFFRLPNELPKPVWKYPCYYISFHKYAVQGFYKNEFIGQTFPSNQLVEKNVTISGLQVLQEKLQVEMGYSKWVNIAILCGMMVVYRMMFFAIVKITEEVRPKRRGMKWKWCK
ncbi:hypothetical protein ACQ4PT_025319 [Festuca glaucescens]